MTEPLPPLVPVPPSALRTGAAMARFFRVAGGFWSGPDRWAAGLLTGGLISLTIVQAFLAVWFNLWSADLFNALERRDADEVIVQSGIFAVIVGATMVNNAAHLEMRRRLQMAWRRWLTTRVVNGWMTKGRQHQLTLIPGPHSNPDARIAEDIRLATEAAVELAHSLFYCLLLLIGFVSILWVLSGTIPIVIGTFAFDLPGHFVWLAFLYAGGGALVAFFLGQPLVRATDRRQTAEANFRFGLVRAREEAEAISLLGGEGNERRRLAGLFQGIAEAWRLQTAGLRSLTVFSSAYSTLATMFPILIAAPRYLAGEMTLGGLMQTAQAFQQLTGALSWPVDNSPRLAETIASIERIIVLQDAIDALTREATHAGVTIDVQATSGGSLTFRDLTIADANGATLFAGISTEIRPGQRVLILGDPQLARTLFKVVAKVWPWGRGRVELPDDAAIHFLPGGLHLPVDTLRAVLAYPDDPERFDHDRYVHALARVGLANLVPRLDDIEEWTRLLDTSERQRVGFARVLLKKPSWVFLEEPGEALGLEAERALMKVLVEELPEVTLLTAAHHAELESFYDRTLRLEPAGDGRVFVRDSGPREPAGGPAKRRWPAIERIRKGFGESDG